ncbi:O-antigen ligase family protein [Gorillibacterium timonense]|uniref:O-antigen ligase family protein n=1 Tax=Gorillibacterium timonense TaxID=1689269 RepID=UPI00131CA3DF|nr:O-antigen ligase family protein [Gorillibacterium timonense]
MERGKLGAKTSLLVMFAALLTTAFAIHPTYILYAAVAALFAWLLFSWKASMTVYLISVTFNRLTLDLSSSSFRPEMIMALVAIGSGVLYVLLNKSRRIKLTINPQSVLFLIFVLYASVVSYINSQVFDYSVSGILQISFAFMGFFLVSQLATFETGAIYRYVNLYIGLGVFQCVYALICFLYNQFTGSFLFGEKYGGLMTGQISGTNWTSITWRGGLYEANLFSAFMGVTIVFIATLLLSKRKVRYPVVLFLSLVLCVVGIIMGWTRSAWIGSVLGLLIVFIFYFKRLFQPKTVLLLVTLLLLLVPTLVAVEKVFDQTSGRENLLSSKLTNLFNGDEGTGKYRVEKLNLAYTHWLDNHPVVGNGYFSIKYLNPDEWVASMFMAVLDDTGVIGLSLFLLLIGSVLFQGFRAAIRTTNPKRKGYLLGLLGGSAVLLFSYNFSPGHTLAMFWAHLGLIWVLSQTRDDANGKPERISSTKSKRRLDRTMQVVVKRSRLRE